MGTVLVATATGVSDRTSVARMGERGGRDRDRGGGILAWAAAGAGWDVIRGSLRSGVGPQIREYPAHLGPEVLAVGSGDGVHIFPIPAGAGLAGGFVA